MKLYLHLKRKFQRFCFILVTLMILTFQSETTYLKALSMDNYQDQIVIEELRLKVPANAKKVWLNAEKTIWDPWLSAQDGFLGRQLYWDKEKEEALILVNWKSKKLWKNISTDEVNNVQEKFEENVKTSLNLNVNPFKLIYEGELFEQV